jgi:hypothetical protein
MLKASIKYKIPFIIFLFWGYSASAFALFGIQSAIGYLFLYLIWISICLLGIFIFKSLKVKYSHFGYKTMHHFFLLAFSSLFFIVYWAYLQKEGRHRPLLEKLKSDSNKDLKIFCLIVGFIILIRAIYVIWKDYKGKNK